MRDDTQSQESTFLFQLWDAWQEWAGTALRDGDGWEAGFPRWPQLMSAAALVMKSGAMTTKVLDVLEQCWVISAETEDLTDFAKNNATVSFPYMCFLVGSESSRVRWQVYEALGAAGASGEPLLRRGLKDRDSYCLRRAVISLAKLAPSDARDLAEAYLESEDPYVRLAAVGLVAASDDAAFIDHWKRRLLRDESSFVRDAALSQL